MMRFYRIGNMKVFKEPFGCFSHAIGSLSFTERRYPQRSSLMNFLCFHISIDYILSHSTTCLGLIHFRVRQLDGYGLREAQSLSFPLFGAQLLITHCTIRHLGFDLMPSTGFFLLSQHITLVYISRLRCSSGSFRGSQQFRCCPVSVFAELYTQISLCAD